jgi:purine nucleoside permease
MFSVEAQQWLDHETFDCSYTPVGGDPTATGIRAVLCHSSTGLCLTTIGVDKVNATASMMAILRDTTDFTFSKSNSYFLTAGTSSTSPYRGTLGMAAWANWVVDWDQGFHLLPKTAEGLPFGYVPPQTTFPDSTSVYHLNETLAQTAYNLTAHLHLQDSTAATAERLLYPSQAGQHPSVVRCDTASGDTIWRGKFLSEEEQYITNSLTNGAGKNCTFEQEDIGVAAVLSRLGFLNQYLDLRSPSAFDQPYPGQTVLNFVNAGFRANDIAAANLYLVGSTVAHYLAP